MGHQQPKIGAAGAAWMKRTATILGMALHTRPPTMTALTHDTSHFIAGRLGGRHVDAGQLDRIFDHHLRYPQCTAHMHPFASNRGLLHGPTRVRAQDTRSGFG